MEYSINPALQELERAYAFFNKELFGGELDSNVIITIQSRGRKRALGWHWAGKWEKPPAQGQINGGRFASNMAFIPYNGVSSIPSMD